MKQPKIIKLENDSPSVIIDPFCGAISAFRLKRKKINPLSFSFSRKQMPFNNKAGDPYQGHFVCLGRWGEPSPGEIKPGLPNHVNWRI